MHPPPPAPAPPPTLLSADIFLPDMLAPLGTGHLLPPPGAAVAAIGAGVLLFAWRDIRLSARLGLWLEAASLAVIVAITALVVARRGTLLDPAQLSPAHFAPGRIAAGLTSPPSTCVACARAAPRPRYARAPARAMKLAVIGSAAACGVFFTGICYCMVLAVGDRTDLIASSASPFGAVTRLAGVPLAAEFVYASALISSFACTLASVNAGARTVFSMSRYGFLPRALGAVHASARTPHVAATVVLVLAAVLAAGLERFRTPVAALGETGTLATFGFLVVYLLLSIAYPLERPRSGRHAVAGGIGAALMLFVLASSLDPWPAGPDRVLPVLFGAYAGMALLAGLVLGRRVRLGEDMEDGET